MEAPSAEPISWPTLLLRGAWIALRLMLVLWLAEAGRTFLYQGF